MRHLSAILMIMISAAAVMAQQPAKMTADSSEQAVIDDDGGRAFIINSKLKPLNELRQFRGTVIGSPQQYSIFLGSEWASPLLHERQTQLDTLLASVSNQRDASKLNSLGIEDFFAATYSQEVLTAFAEGEKISDLKARSVLADLMNSGSLPLTESSTIYVIFLAPRLVSTLGPLTGRKHYLAYHNFFNIAGKRLHYVVIPYEHDLEKVKAIALRALVAAALNPNGEVDN
jgi:hypothetical protein